MNYLELLELRVVLWVDASDQSSQQQKFPLSTIAE